MDFFGVTETEMILQLLLAAFLGAVIGVEREFAQKMAGMRTHSLVALGSALFSIISSLPIISGTVDPTRIAAQVVTGIGFLGGGIIVFSQRDEKVRGLTTAASIWLAAAIGMAVGFHLYLVAAFVTMLSIIILVVFWSIEQRIIKPLAGRRRQGEDAAE
jgi:putative Mg2+ transporter-C (MgtC) family protein